MGEHDFEKLKSLFKSEQLRTLLAINILEHYYYNIKLRKRVLHNILPRLRSLRALSLSHYQIKELPNDLFIKLKLLRFLDLSLTYIEKLPDSVCELYNWETLLLSDCNYLKDLPLQIEKLINLRHLDISNTWRLKMPLHLSKLKSLQVLMGAKFLLGGLRMEDLGEAQNLYGSLSVVKLQNMVDRREAVKEKMREKNHVEKLSLEWSDSSSADNSQTERDILDELCPHTNIKEVEITGYRGKKFPNWLADLSFLKLVQLSLRNCKDCYSLPALGQLPCLKFLSIRGLNGRKNSMVGVVFDDAQLFTSQVEGMKQIEPTILKRIEISRCRKLKLEAPVGEMSMFLEYVGEMSMFLDCKNVIYHLSYSQEHANCGYRIATTLLRF
ncbi:putative disease resistance RPP13-like protein 1 [Solanum stenotomum]|uniref:putative disease resistance RPP13-like protein 1 n=1 Tax=Solanum stenotomum TaxID=172797 RepID=UPI0020D1066B|nr:putative disease resistance RPP13-like protein 1 [Solanum stenotomum]